jgi:hypothetical protein
MLIGAHMERTTHEPGPDQWEEYFDLIAPSLDGLVTIEIMSGQLGDQLDVERLPLRAISYDPKDKTLEVSVGGRGALCFGTSSQIRRRSA